MKFAIVVSRFNQSVTQKLLDGAKRAFSRHGIGEKRLSVFWVPGAFELPLAAKKAAMSKDFDGVVALGCVLKGQTTHNEYIAQAAANGIMNAMLETNVPIAFGVLTPDNMKQALARAGNDSANKGSESAEAVFEMAELLRRSF